MTWSQLKFKLTNLKFKNMKKLFFLLAVAALSLTSCTEEIFNEDSKTDSNQIGFRTMVGKNNNSKALELTDSAFTEFWVSAYRTTGNEDLSTDITLVPYISNLKVTKLDADANTWSYTGAYYWPGTEKLNFFAHNGDITNSAMPSNNITGLPSFNFTQDLGAQKDLVVSYKKNLVYPGNTNPVDFQFQHALCQINFSLKGAVEGPEFIIKKIKVTSIKNKGTFKWSPNLDPSDNNWTGISGTESYTYFNDNNGRSIGTTAVSFGDGSGSTSTITPGTFNEGTEQSYTLTGKEALMIIPQSLDNNAINITVTYNLRQNGVNLLADDATAIADLSSQNLQLGKKIRYTLTIPEPTGTNRIEFSGAISDWETETSTTAN